MGAHKSHLSCLGMHLSLPNLSCKGLPRRGVCSQYLQTHFAHITHYIIVSQYPPVLPFSLRRHHSPCHSPNILGIGSNHSPCRYPSIGNIHSLRHSSNILGIGFHSTSKPPDSLGISCRAGWSCSTPSGHSHRTLWRGAVAVNVSSSVQLRGSIQSGFRASRQVPIQSYRDFASKSGEKGS